MNEHHLSQIWTVIGTVLLYWSVNSWLVLQGGQPFLDLDLVLEDPTGAQIVALHVCPILLFALATVGLRHAQLNACEPWDGRLPVVGLENLTYGKVDTQAYQLVFVLGFVILPLCALVQFVWTLKDLSVVYAAPDAPRADALYSVPQAMKIAGPWGDFDLARHRYRIGLGSDPDAIREGGVGWFPFASPLLLLVFLGATGLQLVRLLGALVARPLDPRGAPIGS